MPLLTHTDTFLEIGSSHRVCQDYVLTARTARGNTLALVCDGCSSSRNVDVGARILAHVATMIMDELPPPGNPGTDAISVGDQIIQQAQAVAVDLGLPDTALDATLLLACHFQTLGLVVVYAWGDGVIACDLGGVKRLVHLRYPSGAPYYLSYRLNDARYERYAAEFGTPKELYSELKTEGGSSAIRSYQSWRLPYVLELPASPGYVILASDGIDSFQKGDPVSYREILTELLAFKSMNGEFITRRMNFFKRHANREGITHYDDFGIAGFSLEECPVAVDGTVQTGPAGSPGVEISR